jgi:hypothetical protein
MFNIKNTIKLKQNEKYGFVIKSYIDPKGIGA